jgi:hypothetical protein
MRGSLDKFGGNSEQNPLKHEDKQTRAASHRAHLPAAFRLLTRGSLERPRITVCSSLQVAEKEEEKERWETKAIGQAVPQFSVIEATRPLSCMRCCFTGGIWLSAAFSLFALISAAARWSAPEARSVERAL